MCNFQTTKKGLMLLAFSSLAFATATAVETVQTVANATAVTEIPTQTENNVVYVIQSQERGGMYSHHNDDGSWQLSHVGRNSNTDGLQWHNDKDIDGTDVNQQFAIITYGGVQYLYSVAAEGFVNVDGNKAVIRKDVNNAALTMTVQTVGTDKFFRLALPNNKIINHSGGYDSNTYKGIYCAAADPDGGNRYNFQALENVTLSEDALTKATDIIDSELATLRNSSITLLKNIREFYHNRNEIDAIIDMIQTAKSATIINTQVNNVLSYIDKKLVYLIYAPNRNTEGADMYLGVDGVGNNRIAMLLPKRGTRAKWQLVRQGNTANFKLRNIASDTYINTVDNGLTTAQGNFIVSFEGTNVQTSAKTVALKSQDSNVCLTIGSQTIDGTDYSNVLCHTADNADAPHDAANAWAIEPVGIHVSEITEGYYVIRSNRGLTNTTLGNDFASGSLLGVYTADRERARSAQNLPTGVHLRQYMTGMQTIWKIVPEETTEEGKPRGFKVYSLAGEMSQDGNLGMTISGDKVTLTNNPSVIYIRDVNDWYYSENFLTSHLPNGVAFCSSNEDKSQDDDASKQSDCFDVSKDHSSRVNGDYFVKPNEWRPNSESQLTNHGTIFYIERVSESDISRATDAYVDYARNRRMFQLLKNVLSPEEEEMAIASKGEELINLDIQTIADANSFLMGGEPASTHAFNLMDGKIVRLASRAKAGHYLTLNASEQLCTSDADTVTDIANLWKFQVVNADLRRARLINYKTGKYAGKITGDNAVVTTVDNVDDAGTFSISRYYSIDGTSFYANLLDISYNGNKNALMTSADSTIKAGVQANLASHWTILPVLPVAETQAIANNLTLQILITNDSKTATIKAPETATSFELTENFPADHKITLVPVVAARNATGNIEIEPGAVTKLENGTFTIDMASLLPANAPTSYNMTIPAGLFTVDGRLSPELKGAVTVTDSTGINSIEADSIDGNSIIYDLQGRRVVNPAKGLYIINGVKTLVK